jgi:PAS domain S-box-containing protein
MTYSSRAREIFGIPEADELTPERIYTAIHPDDRARVMALSRAALDPQVRGREPYEYRVVHADGAVRWILGLGEAIFEDFDGEPKAVRYLGTLQDITARHELEEAERDAAQQLRLALEAGHMAVWDLDVVTNTVTGSSKLYRLLGFPEGQPIAAEAANARYAPGESERVSAEGQAAFARGETSSDAEFRYLHPDLGVRWLRLRYDILVDAAGNPTRVIGVMSDETERRQAEEDLRASEARLKLAASVAGAGVWEHNLRTRQSIWSLEVYELFGIDPAMSPADTHMAWQHLIHPEDREKDEAWVDQVQNETGVRSLDYRIQRPDGEVRWIRSRAVMVPGSDGEPERMVGR